MLRFSQRDIASAATSRWPGDPAWNTNDAMGLGGASPAEATLMRLCGASQTALAGTRSRFDGPRRGSLIQWNLPALCCVLGAHGACVGSGELIILDMSATTSRTAAEREESLVEDLRYNDFDAFYAACWDDVYRPLAVTLRDSELAREAVDEAMARAFARWRQVRTYRNQPGWVYRVGLNWAISQKRRTSKEVQGDEAVDRTFVASLPDADLQNALAHLDVSHRAVVVLRYLMDWSVEDVAATLNIPEGTVKSRLKRALEKLRTEMT